MEPARAIGALGKGTLRYSIVSRPAFKALSHELVSF